ncbi:hypothetical protein ACOSP7_024065 [Xanthoceras sorbifolium]
MIRHGQRNRTGSSGSGTVPVPIPVGTGRNRSVRFLPGFFGTSGSKPPEPAKIKKNFEFFFQIKK